MNGDYRLKLSAGSYNLVYKRLGFRSKTLAVSPKAGETITLKVVLETEVNTAAETEIVSQTDKRDQVSMITLNARNAKLMPSTFGDFNRMLASLPGVVSNNELSSQYAVRGGNFDENLVYVNDMEIYRPFLVRSGQQEGLSFVNPDLVKSVEFSTGGWQPRFGDKLSSVLNVEYKQPTKWDASATLGILSQGGHIEGITKNKRISFVAGVRRKSAQYLFDKSFLTKGLEVTGEYKPRFVDAQANITFDLTPRSDSASEKKTTLTTLFSYAGNRYQVKPASRESDFGTIQKKFRIFIAFDGQEIMNYDTWQAGFKLSKVFSRKLRSDLILSGVTTKERESIDVEGGYNICDVQTDRTKSDYNQCTFSRGVGTMYTYGRNDLDALIVNLLSRNYYKPSEKHHIEYGAGYTQERIRDDLYNYSFIDSVDYTHITEFMQHVNTTLVHRFSAYVQHKWDLSERSTLTYGVRANYGSLNKQMLVSPRLQFSIHPKWEKDVLFRFATGYYQQPPLYREMRDSTGYLNKNLKAQTSVHFIAGSDIKFKMWNRDFKFTAEAYFKNMWHVVAYDVDNVRLRYYANNNTVAYTTGADFRVSGEFVRGAESWFSLGFLRAREDLGFDTVGYVRRPTDQLLTFNIFFQDHLPNNPSARVYLNTAFGTGLPFGPPRDLTNRAAITGPAYRRVDIGFSKVLTMADKTTRMGRYFDSVWIGLEILNIMGVSNTISYTWIKDFSNNSFAIPNTLSTRFYNLRVIMNFGS